MIYIKRKELVLAILYSFRFIFKLYIDNNGNYDLFYLVAIYAATMLVLYDFNKFLKTILYCFPLLLCWILSVCFGPSPVSTIKAIIFILKILICINLYLYVKEKAYLFDFQYFIDCCSIFFFIQSIIALTSRNSSILWRVSEGRMELFYLEPSELGVFVGILVLSQVYLILRSRNYRKLINIACLAFTLVLTSSLSGILYTVFSVAVLLVFDRQGNSQKGIDRRQIFFLLVCVIGICLLLSNDNYISNRFFNALNGEDSSFNTRSAVPVETLVKYFQNYGGIGYGFGNMNTNEGFAFFSLKARNYVICAALFLFAIEGGAVALIYELCFTVKVFSNCIKQHSSFSIALFLFMLIYMFLGGYTTNPVVWILLAIMQIPEEDLLFSSVWNDGIQEEAIYTEGR